MIRLTRASILVCAATLAYASSTLCCADTFWSANGLAVCDSAAGQSGPVLAGDGEGGAVVVWADQALGDDCDIVAQRVDADGDKLWTTGGSSICAAAFDQYFPAVASSNGDFLIAWQDLRAATAEADIYAQKTNAVGVTQWASGGTPVCMAAGDQYSPVTAPDGVGGAYIAWRDTRNDLTEASTDIYAQHAGADGTLLWPSDIAIATTPLQDDRDVIALSDGTGGVILVWQDARGVSAVSTTGKDIYAQRIASDGTLLWGSSGLPVCQAVGDQRYPEAVSDGSGGVFVVWDDKRGGVNYDIYAQHLSSSGVALWAVNGSPVCTATGNQIVPTMSPDGAGGVFVAWTDARSGSTASYYDVFCQRLTPTGTPAWTLNGISVCSASGWQGRVKSMPDGAGSMLVTWSDNRVDPTNTTYNYDIYAQKLNSAGSPQWASNGVAVCAYTGKQELQNMTTTAYGNAVVAWQDSRVDPNKDIYAQKIGSIVPVAGIADAKSRSDGSWLQIGSQVVTAVFGNSFYMESSDRYSGIKVDAIGSSENQEVTVQGQMDTVNGERVLASATILNSVPAAVIPRPLFMINRSIGGTGLGQYTPGITGCSDLNNVGLLITTTGLTGYSGTGFVYIDDGSRIADPAGNTGLKVDTTRLTSQPSGLSVITGISSAEILPSGDTIRVLRPRRDSDVIPR